MIADGSMTINVITVKTIKNPIIIYYTILLQSTSTKVALKFCHSLVAPSTKHGLDRHIDTGFFRLGSEVGQGCVLHLGESGTGDGGTVLRAGGSLHLLIAVRSGLLGLIPGFHGGVSSSAEFVDVHLLLKHILFFVHA